MLTHTSNLCPIPLQPNPTTSYFRKHPQLYEICVKVNTIYFKMIGLAKAISQSTQVQISITSLLYQIIDIIQG
jgi:hypothetical protein